MGKADRKEGEEVSMAARVNTKFVIVLGTLLMLMFVGVAVLGVRAIRKSGEDYITLGDKAIAEGKTPEAMGFYAKAVFKDQKNSTWIRKWITAMEKYVPVGRASYFDEYQKQYLAALRALPEADKSDLAAHKRYLSEIYTSVKSSGSSLGELEYVVRTADEMIKGYQGEVIPGKVLLRYRALPKVALLLRNPDFKPEELVAIKKDLDDVLTADPSDTEVLIAAAQIDMALAERARKRDETEDAERFKNAAISRLTTFITEHPPASTVRLMVLMQEAQAAAVASGKPVTVSELLQDRKPQLLELLAAVKAEKPEKLDVSTLTNAAFYAQIALSPEDGRREAEAVIDAALTSQPNNVQLLLSVANLDRMRNEPEKALARLQQVVDMPDRPLSAEGVMLFRQRELAIQGQTDVVFEQWEREKDPAKKSELGAKAKKYRNDLVARIGESADSVLSIDARLAFIDGDRNGARTLLTRYNDQTGQRDPQSMALLGELLIQQGNTGAAKQTFERVMSLDSRNQRAMRYLGQIELQARNYPEALRYFRELQKLNPDDAAMKDQVEQLIKVIAPDSKDPIIKVLRQAEAESTGVGADVPMAIATLETFLEKVKKDDIRPYIALMQLHMRTKDRTKAAEVIGRAIAQFPTDERLKGIQRSLLQEDPVKSVLEDIDKATALSPLDKAMQKYSVLKQSPRAAEATEYFDEMVRLAPEDPSVVEYRFQEAMQAKDTAKLAEIVALAEAKNIDKLGGLLFLARSQILENKAPEAVQSLRSALERDKLNHTAWRLLGVILMNQRDAAGAVEAFTKAVEIRPNDIQSINGLLKSHWAMGSQSEALTRARRSEGVAGADPEFTELLLQIESTAPGGDRDKAAQLRARLAETRPENKMNQAELILILMEQRKFEEAQKNIDKLKGDEATKDAVTELQARWFALQGKYGEAEQVYDDRIKQEPAEQRNEGVYIAASKVFQIVGQPDRAIAFLERGRELEKKESMLISREMGDVFFNSGKQAEAVEAYKRVLDSGSPDPGDAVVKRILECHVGMKDWAKFDELLTSLGTKAQQDATLLLLAAGAAGVQGDAGRAARLYDQAVVAEPKNAMVFMKRGEFAASDPEKRRDAIEDFKQAAKLAPNSTLPLLRLALLHKSMGKIDLASEALEQALVKDPGDDGLRSELMSMKLNQKQDAAAITLLDDAIKLKPDNLPWLMRGGSLMSQLGRSDLAAGYYGRAWEKRKTLEVAVPYVTALITKKPPDTATAWKAVTDKDLGAQDEMTLSVLKAMIFQRWGKPADADVELAKAHEKVDSTNAQQAQLFAAGVESVYPDDNAAQLSAWGRLDAKKKLSSWVYVQANLARLREPTTQNKAATDLEAFVAKSEDVSMKLSVYRLLATFYFQVAKYPNAVDMYRKFLEIEPNDAESLNNLAYVLATELKQPGDALPYAQKAVDANPNSPNALDTLGVCQLGLRDLDNAIKTLTAAVEKSKTDNDRVPSMIHLAEAHFAKSARPEARRLAEQVQTILKGDAALNAQHEKSLKELEKLLDGQ